jgi:hypothetical protein
MTLPDACWKLCIAAYLFCPQPARSAESRPLALRVIPEKVSLWGVNASQRFLVLAKYNDGLERDITTDAQLSISSPTLGRLEDSRFHALADGSLTLTASYMGKSATSALSISGLTEKLPFSYTRNIGGILTKRGCNSTTCHGSVKGKAGFKLSSDTEDPREDYRWIVEGGTYQVLSNDRGAQHPRIDLKEPEKSLILQKPTMSIPHGGGLRFSVGSEDYQIILNWVKAGAPYGADDKSHVRITSVEVLPKQTVLDLRGRQHLLVMARLSNGSDEDLTDQVMYVSNNPEVVKVNEAGLVQAAKAGETAVLIRAAGHALSAEFGVVQQAVANYPDVPRRNFIDEFIFSKLRKMNIVPSALSSDAEFLRRLCLDVAGTLPPPERVRQFVASRDPQKREKLIETLLNSPEYIDYWTFRFSDLLRVTQGATLAASTTQAYADWVRNSVAENKPYDQIARERIAGQGFSASVRDYYHVTDLLAPQAIMAEQLRIFWGRRLDCAQCHNHPFENWTQSQFWGLTAFFGHVTEIRDYSAVIDSPHGGRQDENEHVKVLHPRTKEEVPATFLDGRKLGPGEQDDPRGKLADWMIASPYFAEAAVNRVWSYFFARGIVEPVDDFRTTNPPTHPELIEALARDFRDHGYDLKHLMRLILQSRTYQLSGVPNETNAHDELNYSRALPRPLEAAVLLDAISRVTGVAEEFKLHKSVGGGAGAPGALAVSMIPDVCPSQFMDAFGRSMRKAPPAGHPEPNLLEALHMWAGTTYTTKIGELDGRIDHLIKSGASDRDIVQEFYLAALTRNPTPEEMDALQTVIAKRQQRRQTLEDFVWALINSREFAYNH